MATVTTGVSAPISPDQAEKLEQVERNKFYYVTIQVGASIRWRGMGGKKRSEVAGPNGTKRFDHEWKVHEQVGPFTGSDVNGLIVEHNEWIDKYRQRRGAAGFIDRAILVLDIQETRDLPREVSNRNYAGMVPIGTVQDLVQAEVNRLLGKKEPV